MAEASQVRIARAAAGLILLGVTGCSSSTAAPTAARLGLPCPAKPTGALCIRVLAHHLRVDDVIGYLASSEPVLTGQTWRLVLSTFPCDPGLAARPRCAPTSAFPGPIRHGEPPAATSCRVPAGGVVVTAPAGCHDTLAQAMGSQGDWTGFDPLSTQDKPVTFNKPVWLCVSEQLLTSQGWQSPNDQSSPTPPRACKALTAG